MLCKWWSRQIESAGSQGAGVRNALQQDIAASNAPQQKTAATNCSKKTPEER